MKTPDKILVVDDIPTNLTILFNRLSQYGYKVLVAQDGESAIRQATYAVPDIILLDVMMPGIDGFETCRQLKQIEATQNIPVIFMTALSDMESKLKGFEAGGVDYVTKPIDYQEILARLQTHLTICNLQKDLQTQNRSLENEIFKRKQIEMALRQSEERYALAARGANDGLWDWNLENNHIYYSPRWKDMLGYDDQAINQTILEWFSRVHPEDFYMLQQQIINHLNSTVSTFECEYRILHNNGDYCWMLCRGLAVRHNNKTAYRFAGSQTDITSRKKAEARLIHDANHDALTGLPNRIVLMKTLTKAITQTQKNPNHLFAMLFLDLDNFKLVNDTFGHSVGDQLLITIAQRLKNCVRPNDLVARLGGDEFTVLINPIYTVTDAEQVANRIQSSIAQPIVLGGQQVFTSVSIGIIINTDNDMQAEDLLRDADKAMYEAKASGRGKHKLFDITQRDKTAGRLQLESELRQATQNQDFLLYYQPIFTLSADNKTMLSQSNLTTLFQPEDMISVEVTIAWNHPIHGLMRAHQFLPLAQEIGIIQKIDHWILEQACQQLAVWRANYFPNLELLLNVSISYIRQPDIEERIISVLNENNLPASAICLEIGDVFLSKSSDNILTSLQRLQNIGVYISLDGFGDQHTALMHLKKLPLNRLKITPSFITNITEDDQDKTIVASIINLACHLNLQVIVPNITTVEQLKTLTDQNCSYVQGSLFGKPSLADEFLTYFT